MRAAAKTRPAGTSAAILTCALLSAAATSVAFAQDAPASVGRDVINGQVQLGDVFADQRIVVTTAEQTVNAATAVGNIASATGVGGDLSFTSTQTNAGAIKATATTQADDSATGNAGTAGTCCGAISGSSHQTSGDKDVTAGGYLDVATYAYALSNDAAAVGNTQGWLTSNGAVRALSEQRLTGSVVADASSRSGEVETLAGTSATAVGNDVTASGTGASSVDLVTDQANSGFAVTATVTGQHAAGDEVAGQATATSNNVTIENEGGASLSAHTQVSSAAVTADAAYGLGTWNSATVASYGVGNSVYASNIGAQTELGIDQTNTGAVTGKASLVASSGGGDTYVSATAVGNAAQGLVCSTCDGGVGISNSQNNSGAVRAVASYHGPATGSVVGAASAVGNTATFTVRAPGS